MKAATNKHARRIELKKIQDSPGGLEDWAREQLNGMKKDNWDLMLRAPLSVVCTEQLLFWYYCEAKKRGWL